MQLFRVKKDFTPASCSDVPHARLYRGQLFVVKDETELPDPRDKYPGNLKPYYEEIVPNSLLVKQFTNYIKTKEL